MEYAGAPAPTAKGAREDEQAPSRGLSRALATGARRAPTRAQTAACLRRRKGARALPVEIPLQFAWTSQRLAGVFAGEVDVVPRGSRRPR